MSEMNYLDKLLNGVAIEWLPIGDVTQYEQPAKYLVSATNYSNEFKTPVLTAGKTVVLGYTDELDGIYSASRDPVIIFDDFTTANKWINFDFKIKSSAIKMITSKSEKKVLLKYIYYLLNMMPSELTDSDHKRHWIGSYTNKKIPIPCPDSPEKSMAIQAEIVRILDAFTELTAELTAELAARKRQYRYYRDHLLRVEGREVEWKTLGEIGEFIRGKRFTKADYVDDGISAIHYGEIYTRYGAWTGEAFSKVRRELASSLRYARRGDVVIAGVGETVEDVGKAVAWIGEQDIAIHDDSYAFRHSMNPKFISYAMQTASFISEKAKHVSRGKVNRLLIDGMAKVRVPIPYPGDARKSLAEQARIVAILDKFDALTSSLREGLPREIALRQQQYAHYRNLLLSFPKPETAV